MPRQQGKVSLLDVTDYLDALAYQAYRQCYSSGWVGDKPQFTGQQITELLTKMSGSPHVSPLEHGKFTFAIAGISRACSHQLVRHRIASFAQQSQRYCGEGEDMDYIVPPSIQMNQACADAFGEFMEQSHALYQMLQDAGIPNEDARFVLPNAAETKIVMTMNCSSLLHFFRLRCCSRAQWEIRAIADQMLRICRSVSPVIFANAGPPCKQLQYCPEPEGMGCGAFPSRETTIKGYKEYVKSK